MLQAIDYHWKDHLLGIDQLKEGIGLRGYGQKDPRIEYQKEAYQMFLEMLETHQEGYDGKALRRSDCQGTRGSGGEGGAETDLRPEPGRDSAGEGGERPKTEKG